MTTENELQNESTTFTSDSHQLATSSNSELLDAQSTTLNHDYHNNQQHTSANSTIAITAALGAIAVLSCFIISILLMIVIIRQRKRSNGKIHDYVW